MTAFQLSPVWIKIIWTMKQFLCFCCWTTLLWISNQTIKKKAVTEVYPLSAFIHDFVSITQTFFYRLIEIEN